MRTLLQICVTMGLVWTALSCQDPTNTSRQPGDITDHRQVPGVVDFNFHVKPILSDKCFKCHGPDENAREADLALHEKASAFSALGEDQYRYAIIPGDPENSHLVQRIRSTDPDEIMPAPESKLALTEYEKDVLEQWIAQGADWKEHWSFIPPFQPEVPEHQDAWVRNEIDQFVLDRLMREGMSPSPAADKEALLRRVTFALTGLPPTIEELDRFLASDQPDAYTQVVDRLLSSKAYAERMAQTWMDIARYADSHGYQDDPERFMWPWRDWIIHALDVNMPYDQFVKWQLAGDMLPEASLEQVVASGFNRNHKISYEGGVIAEEFRTEYVADRAQTFGTAFLGLTVECARCHDHKYDPISQENFYELFAFFNNIDETGEIVAVGTTPEPYVVLTDQEMANTLRFINNLDTVEKVELMVMREREEPRKTFVLERGLYDHPATEVLPSTPGSVLAFKDLPPNRIGLAEWLFDPSHPLTARVAVNRLWQLVFGKGIVASSFDFGNQGTLPSHPELLDFLALKFRDDGWDIKRMLRYMVMSATFRQSSVSTPEHLKKDPENILLARATRIRLEAEMVRDNFLKVAGILCEDVGGPSVKPYQPPGLWEETIGGGGDLRAYIQDSGNKLYRRSLYTFWKRTVPPPSMLTFDAATRDLCTIKRQETNTPLQALNLLNDPQIVEAARLLAHAALKLDDTSLEERIRFMFRRTTSRYPNDRETEILVDYYRHELEIFEQEPDQAASYLSVGEYLVQSEVSIPEFAAHALVANAIFNLDESINRG